MKMTLSFVDVLVIVLYFGSVILLGFKVAGKKKIYNKIEFILDGRKLTLPLFVGTLVATWYGNILGVGEFVYNHGFVAWVCFGITYYIAAILYSFLIAKKIRLTDSISIPEQIESRFGKRNSLISSMIVLVITIPGAYILMLGVLLQLFTGWPLWISVIIGTSISVIYIIKGGFKSDVITNSFQFVIMYLGFGSFLVFTYLHYGSPFEMLKLLPVHYKEIFGGFSWMYVISWVFIAFQTFVDPSFFQRCSAAISPKSAQKGILISVAFWILFDIMTLLTGLYAKAYISGIQPVMAYPALAEIVLPNFWKGIFIVTLLATIMSTLNSYAFLSASTISNDILLKFKILSKFSITYLTRLSLIITSVLGILLALLLPSPIEIVFRTASIAVPGLILPLTLSFFLRIRISNSMVTVIMCSSSLVSLALFLVQSSNFCPNILKELEPMLAGLIVSIMLTLPSLRIRH